MKPRYSASIEIGEFDLELSIDADPVQQAGVVAGCALEVLRQRLRHGEGPFTVFVTDHHTQTRQRIDLRPESLGAGSVH